MKILAMFAAVAVLSPLSAAQNPTPTAVINPGPFQQTQLNTLESCLIVFNASVQAPGLDVAPFPGIMSLFSQSKTFAYTCDSTQTGVAPGILSYPSTTLEGGANQPFALGLSVVPGSMPCGGTTGIPCMSNGSLFDNQVTPYGRYHLTATPVILFDGLTPGHPSPGVLNGFGQFSLSGMLNIDTAANGGAESRFAVQAIVVDPGAAAGLTLSACLNVDQWVQ